jgi:hypothetical protein
MPVDTMKTECTEQNIHNSNVCVCVCVGFVICGRVCVCVLGFVMCGCFGFTAELLKKDSAPWSK